MTSHCVCVCVCVCARACACVSAYSTYIHGTCVDTGMEPTLHYFFTYIDGYIHTHTHGVLWSDSGDYWKDNLEQKM
jgi:hypothetical protein